MSIIFNRLCYCKGKDRSKLKRKRGDLELAPKYWLDNQEFSSSHDWVLPFRELMDLTKHLLFCQCFGPQLNKFFDPVLRGFACRTAGQEAVTENAHKIVDCLAGLTDFSHMMV